MALVNWNNNLSVNIKSLDNQHKKLIGVINELHDAMKEGQANNIISKVLLDLSNYAKIHFQSEEALFEKYNYPEKITHKKEHDAFAKKVEKYIDDYKNGKTNLSIEVINFLTHWLINHIQKSDRAYSDFLNNHGIY